MMAACFIKQRRLILECAAVFGVLVLQFLTADARPDRKDEGYAKAGRALFVQYCVSCHGSGAAGDGPAVPSLKIQPPDLTMISRESGGFPFDRIQNAISGEKVSSAHGSREMPVWGKRFRDAKRSEAGGLGDVYALTKYLQSIQK